jgi:hypothetical protein
MQPLFAVICPVTFRDLDHVSLSKLNRRRGVLGVTHLQILNPAPTAAINR